MTRDVLFHVCEADVSLLGQSGTRGRGGGGGRKEKRGSFEGEKTIHLKSTLKLIFCKRTNSSQLFSDFCLFELEDLNGAVIPGVVKRHNVETLKSHKGERERRKGGTSLQGYSCRIHYSARYFSCTLDLSTY